jgi:23S rRNA (cytidine1920-2'-O)/16S rRNA (cytidine1409-2'-O)-methyltransferase
VDVDSDQLHAKLRGNPRVVALGKDRRAGPRRRGHQGPIGAIVADVSFISLTKALPAAPRLAAPDAWLVALAKPQF